MSVEKAMKQGPAAPHCWLLNGWQITSITDAGSPQVLRSGNWEDGAASHLLALSHRLTRLGLALDAQIYPQKARIAHGQASRQTGTSLVSRFKTIDRVVQTRP
jgi:hypothetical protein